MWGWYWNQINNLQSHTLSYWLCNYMGFPGGSVGKVGISCNTGDTGDIRLIRGLGRFLWRRAWQPTPVFLPGEAHGQRSLAGYSPWSYKESDPTEATEHASTRAPVYTGKSCCNRTLRGLPGTEPHPVPSACLLFIKSFSLLNLP